MEAIFIKAAKEGLGLVFQIKKAAKRVKSNKAEAQALAERLNEFEEVLRRNFALRKKSKRYDQNVTRERVESFIHLLSDLDCFLQYLSRKDWKEKVKKVYKGKKYEQKLQEFHARLDQQYRIWSVNLLLDVLEGGEHLSEQMEKLLVQNAQLLSRHSNL